MIINYFNKALRIRAFKPLPSATFTKMQEAVKEYYVLGMGNPLLDISSEVPQQILTKYNMKTNSAILMDEKQMPLFDQLVKMPTVEYIPGGSTLNSIRSSQWMLKPEHPGSCAYLGCIGKDDIGKKMQDILKEETLDGIFSIDEETPTGKCAVLVHKKDRALGAYLGAAIKFPKEHFLQYKDIIDKARVIYIACFFLTSNKEVMLEAARLASEKKKKFGLNLSAFFLIDQFKEEMVELIEHSDFVFGNETEAAHFSKAHNLGTENIMEIAQKIAVMKKSNQDHPRYVIITQGKLPTVVVKFDPRKPEQMRSEEYPVVLLDQNKVVDTNGAGDSFVGGFLSEIAKGNSTEVAIKAGQYCASEVIQRSGCSFPEEKKFESS